MNTRKKHITSLLVIILAILMLNVIGSYVYHRFDLTEDYRYTLSSAAKETIDNVESPLTIDVFLEGEFPSEFKRLKAETKQLLEEFSAYNPNVHFEFINPLETENPEALIQEFSQRGMMGAQVEVRENGRLSTATVYPWAIAFYNDKSVKIPLLKNQLGATSEERVNSSVQNLEYAFADGFSKLTNAKTKTVAILKGNGELQDVYIADFLKTIGDYYRIAPFTLDSAAVTPTKTLGQLKTFDLIIAAKPTEAFSDTEKYILDQYIMNGGASLWLVDATEMKKEPESQKDFAFGKDLNVNDFFFKYGVRVNPNLVEDVYSAPITLASGSQSEAQYNRYPWFFYPLSSSANNHPIVTNIEAVKFEYASSIDTLKNGIEKTVLLSTSPMSKIIGLPQEIDLEKEIPKNLEIVNEGPDPSAYNAGEVPLAVLLEGEFTSVFSNRVKPFQLENDKTISTPTKMVVISDGDVIKNQLNNGKPLELGFDKWTNQFYGNKEFLLNTVNYLLDDSGLINIRTKEISVAFLNPEKTAEEKTKWQVINLALPLILLGTFGFLFYTFRKRKYAKK